MKINKLFIFVIAAYAVYAGLFIYNTSFIVNGERYFALFDDAMISMRYAKNLANGAGLVWNAGGSRVEGYTNPLWVFYMALFHLLPIPLSKMSLIIQFTGFILLTCNLFVVKKISEIISQNNTFIVLSSVILTAFYFPLNTWGLEGMEVSLLVLIVDIAIMVVICLNDREKLPVWLYFLLGCSTLVRIDAAVFCFAILGFYALSKRDMKGFIVGASIISIFLGVQTLLRFWYYGDILPNTYYLKMTGFPLLPRIIRGIYVIWHMIRGMGVFVLPLPFLILLFRRDTSILLLLWVFLVQLLYSVYVGGDAWDLWIPGNRFIALAMPAFCINLVILIYCSNAAISSRYPFIRRYSNLMLGLCVILSAMSMNRSVGRQPLNRWLLVETPFYAEENRLAVEKALILDTVTSQQAKIAVIQAGTLPYFLDREMIDLLGKNDRVIAHRPMRPVDDTGSPLLSFFPGHMKWDYAYSIGQLHPDIIAELWINIEELNPYLTADYDEVQIRGIRFWQKKQ